MTRRIVRSAVQLTVIFLTIAFLVVFLDSRYDVLPRGIHDRLPTHHPGLVITDIEVKSCSTLNPLSSCRLDPNEWKRLEKDLYLGKQWYKAFVHIKRKREEQLEASDKVVVDVKISHMNPSKQTGTVYEKWEQRNAGIWILRSSKRHESDSNHVITAVDVLYGADAVDPRIGWEMRDKALVIDPSGGDLEPHLSVHRGAQKHTEKPILQFKPNSKFKIMQAADLHLSTGVGACRDTEPQAQRCEADTRTLDFVRSLLEDEKPDLVVLTGDQVNGETAPDAQSAIFKFADLLIKYQIPYACIFGNHDDLGEITRFESMDILKKLPYSLSDFGPTAVNGVGNYVLEVQAPGRSHHSALSLYFLDTHGNTPDPRHFPGYNWIKDEQIKWFESEVDRLKQKHSEFAKIHTDMAFIHIPLPEYRFSEPQKVVGERKEDVTAPNFNSHFKDALVEKGVRLVTAGHDHVNDYCRLDMDANDKPQLWMCYGGGAGFGGYGGHGGYTRRIRFFEFDANGGKVKSWKRLESGDTKTKFDSQILIEGGHAVLDL